VTDLTHSTHLMVAPTGTVTVSPTPRSKTKAPI